MIKTYNSYQVYNRLDLSRSLRKLRQSPNSAFSQALRDKRKGYYLVYYLEDKIVAWSFMTKRGDASYQIGVYVHPNYRRKGIGSALLSRGKEIAQRYNRRISGDGWNSAALNFFKANKVPDTFWEYRDEYYGSNEAV